MHYAQYKHTDPSLVKAMVETFPFAAVVVNGANGPLIAQAPMTFREGPTAAGTLEFHLAKANPIAAAMVDGAPITIFIRGPGAEVSPSWFTSTFPDPKADRSRTAPTYNYLSIVINGRLELMDDRALQNQIKDLVRASEPSDGWRPEELAPDLWPAWMALIQGYRLRVDRFDLTAKLTPGDSNADKTGVLAGLRGRAKLDDLTMARMVENYDGSPESLAHALATITVTQL